MLLAREKATARYGRPAVSGPQQAWASERTIDVVRNGPLVRQERKLADGAVPVRYQYGNGPHTSRSGRAPIERGALAIYLGASAPVRLA
jgi:hypothetical protein